MNKTVKTLFLLIFALTLLTAPVLGTISDEEAVNIAEKYLKNNETATVYGPYTCQNRPYYYTEYIADNASTNLSGVLVIDKSTGNVVSDEQTLRQILFTVYYLKNVSNEVVAASNLTALQYKTTASNYEQQAETVKNTRPYIKEGDWNKMENLEQYNRDVANLFNKMAATHEEIAAAGMDVLDGNLSYENAMKLSKLFTDLGKDLKLLDAAYDNVSRDMNIYYDILIESPGYYQVNATLMSDLRILYNANIALEKQVIELFIDEIEKDFQNTQTFEDSGVLLSNERIKTNSKSNSIPGFGFIAAVFALSVIGVFIRRQKK
jgi:PGF-CTERM protein